MNLSPETIQQIIVVDWVKQCTDLPIIHIANERGCSFQQGKTLKRMGVLSGVSDLFIPRATKNRHGMFLELKTLKGKLTRNQIKFIDDMNKEGYYALAAYGSDNAIAIIKDFYEINIKI
jgi:hypothetical protein